MGVCETDPERLYNLFIKVMDDLDSPHSSALSNAVILL